MFRLGSSQMNWSQPKRDWVTRTILGSITTSGQRSHSNVSVTSPLPNLNLPRRSSQRIQKGIAGHELKTYLLDRTADHFNGQFPTRPEAQGRSGIFAHLMRHDCVTQLPTTWRRLNSPFGNSHCRTIGKGCWNIPRGLVISRKSLTTGTVCSSANLT